MQYSIGSLDYVVIGIYLILIFIVAFFSGKKKNQVDGTNIVQSQYLANKSLTFSESLFSIIATEVSALTFLGIPAFAYATDFSFIHIYLGAIVGRFFIATVILPRIYGDELTVYSAMARKNGTMGGRRSVALFYLLNKILAVGVRLFSGSILVAQFFNMNIYMAVFLICVLTFFYTLIGGLKAVVRTDMIQMGLFVTGGIVAHYLIPQVAGVSWSDLMEIANQGGKTVIFNMSDPSSFLIGIFGGILFDMATHGVDQDFAQRLTANRSFKTAQKAILCSSFISILVGLLFLGIGALLWAYYQSHTPPNVTNDQLFAYFITQHFPVGLKGLMVAGVLAATMSTLDSTINALSACFYNDIAHQRDDSNIEGNYKKDTLIITLLLMVIAFIAAQSDGLLLLGLKITSWTAGSLIALFFASLVWNKFFTYPLNTISVIGSYLFGAIGVGINTYVLEWPWQWNVYFGFIFSLSFIRIMSIGKKHNG